MITVLLEGRGELAEWRDAARRLASSGVPPENIDWRERHGDTDLFVAPDTQPKLPPLDAVLRRAEDLAVENRISLEDRGAIPSRVFSTVERSHA